MKICLFTSSLNRGGAERVFVNLANHWVGLGHAVDLVVFSADGALREEVDPAVNVISLGEHVGRLPLRLAAIVAFSKYLKSAQPDRVFATLTYVTITALWARVLARYRGCVVVRQANSLSNQSHQSMPIRLWNWFGYHLAYRWADVILVNSKNSENEVAKMLPSLKSKLRLVYNPVIIGDFVPVKTQKEVPVILSSGRFARQKDFPTLLRAFKIIRERREAHLIILGDGPDRKQIEALIRELGIVEHVTLKGYVSDPSVYYKQADVFVLTSLWEGFPNVLVEALAAGTAVVATDGRGGSREIVESILPDNIVEVGNAQQVADRVCGTLEAMPSGVTLKNYVSSRFALPIIAEQYLNL
jgi:glycosyltransferase involved in cell wall biosynthesis